MDGLEALAWSSLDEFQEFCDQRAGGAGRSYDALRVREPAAAVDKARLDEEQLGGFFAPARREFRLVHIKRQAHSNVLDIGRASFTRVFRASGCSPCALDLIAQDYDGFHHFAGPGAGCCYYIGTAWYALVWTFRPDDGSTNAVFIHRRGDRTYQGFVRILDTYARYLLTPESLIFVSVLHQIRLSDLETAEREAITIRQIENATGYRWNPERSAAAAVSGSWGGPQFQIADVAHWSQKVGEILGHVSNKIRHQNLALSLLAHLAREFAARLERPADDDDDGQTGRVEDLCEAIPVLERKVRAYEGYLLFLQDRSRNLSSVLFAILTHKDAVAGMQLAQTSHELAETARRDTSSMKTLAVMTMAFLPGTFFATLFALPFFKWEQPAVVQDSFRVYLAFTVPSTAVIFLVWLAVTNRSLLTRWLGRNCVREPVGPHAQDAACRGDAGKERVEPRGRYSLA
ncbi:hypothetical protein CDD83_4465 [Cordyceps sp. RAO-2017]|nr:hypothetical protein CDD83_4465 [Cordyceps sp. RAO-2017]